MKKRKKIPGKISGHRISFHSALRMKERGIPASDIEMALKHGEVENSILRYKNLEIVLSDEESKLITAWDNGKVKADTVLTKKDQKKLSSRIVKKKEKKQSSESIEFDNYDDYLNFLKKLRD